MAYAVATPVFEGPFDLLLHLILREEVDIHEVSLSTIVEAYLAEVAKMTTVDLEVATEFLLIAATLIDLKTRRLLPTRDNGEIDEERSQALLAAYSALRHFTPAEAHLWHAMLRIACVRFWLSRLIAARHFAGRDVTIKNPDEFHRLLMARQQPHSALPFAF